MEKHAAKRATTQKDEDEDEEKEEEEEEEEEAANKVSAQASEENTPTEIYLKKAEGRKHNDNMQPQEHMKH